MSKQDFHTQMVTTYLEKVNENRSCIQTDSIIGWLNHLVKCMVRQSCNCDSEVRSKRSNIWCQNDNSNKPKWSKHYASLSRWWCYSISCSVIETLNNCFIWCHMLCAYFYHTPRWTAKLTAMSHTRTCLRTITQLLGYMILITIHIICNVWNISIHPAIDETAAKTTLTLIW